MVRGSEALRERTRRAVRSEIMAAAQRLFLARGYEATTVDEIAVEAQISPRSVYRYFPAKDDLLVGRFAESANTVVEALSARPVGEPVWESLHAALEPLAQHADGAADREAVRRLHQTIFATPSLLGRYLQHLHTAQLAAHEMLLDRADRHRSDNRPDTGEAAALLAVVNAAFGCFVAAQQTWCTRQDDVPLATVLDTALRAARPAGDL